MPEPCPRCGVRSDLGCAHQAAEGGVPANFLAPPKDDGRARSSSGNGWNFHRFGNAEAIKAKIAQLMKGTK